MRNSNVDRDLLDSDTPETHRQLDSPVADHATTARHARRRPWYTCNDSATRPSATTAPTIFHSSHAGMPPPPPAPPPLERSPLKRRPLAPRPLVRLARRPALSAPRSPYRLPAVPTHPHLHLPARPAPDRPPTGPALGQARERERVHEPEQEREQGPHESKSKSTTAVPARHWIETVHTRCCAPTPRRHDAGHEAATSASELGVREGGGDNI